MMRERDQGRLLEAGAIFAALAGADCISSVLLSAVMAYYIAFRLTHEGHVIDASEMYCSEDEAIERARELASDGPVELWHGSRRVARFEAKRGT